MRKRMGWFQKGRGKCLILAACLSVGTVFSGGIESIQAVSTPSAVLAREEETTWKEAKQEVAEIEEQLILYQEAMEQLKSMLAIQNTGSVESQIEEILIKVKREITYAQDLKNEMEKQVSVDFLEIDTEGMSQTQAIFTKIGELRLYAQRMNQFYQMIQELFGLEDSSTNQEVYQRLLNLKEKIAVYHSFLDQAETLLQPEGVNGSSSLVTTEQTKEELRLVYDKMETMKEQLDFLKELLPVLLDREEISIENKEAQKELLEEIRQGKEEMEDWMGQIRDCLELQPDAGQAEISNLIFEMKTTLVEYWNYLGEVEVLLSIEDGSSAVTGSSLVVGSPVAKRLKEIYKKLTDMVQQQDKMAETIQVLQKKEEVYQEKEESYQKQLEELKQIEKEMVDQKEQTNQFLSKLKMILGLKPEAGEEEIVEAIFQIKTLLSDYWSYLGEVEELLQMPDGSGLDVSGSMDHAVITKRWTDFYQKLMEMVEEQDQMRETISRLQEKEALSLENIQELSALLEEMKVQREEADGFLKKIKEVLGLGDQAEYQEVVDTIQKVKEQVAYSLQLVQEFVEQFGVEIGEGEGTLLTKQLETIFEQVWVWMEQLEKEVEKTKQAEQRIVQLEQEVRILTVEKQQTDLENRQLKKENEQLKQESSFEAVEKWEKEQKELEQENQSRREEIVVLKEKLQSCAKGKESLRTERDRLLEELLDQEKERKEDQKQILLLKEQLKENKRKVEDFEAMQKKQKPIQDLLEQHQISYERLQKILSELEEQQTSSAEKEETSMKEEISDQDEEATEEQTESVLREKEMIKIIQQEIPQQKIPQKETIVIQQEETTSLKAEEVSSNLEETSVERETCTTRQEEYQSDAEGCFCERREMQMDTEDCFCGRKEYQGNSEGYFCEKDCWQNPEECFCRMEEWQGSPEECPCQREEWQESGKESTDMLEETRKEEESLIEESKESSEEETKEEGSSVQEKEEQKNGKWNVVLFGVLFLSVLIGGSVWIRKNRKERQK